MTRLQVLICAYGKTGLERIVKSSHPKVEGVEYLVSLQTPEKTPDIPVELQRDDFRIVAHDSVGVARNRNMAIQSATAPVAMMTDDDVSYREDELRELMRLYDEHPEVEVVTTRYRSKNFQKQYPDHSFSLAHPPRGYYVSCIEISFRTSSVKGNVTFNEHFGINTTFEGGEEDVFIHDAKEAGLDCRFYPITIGTHDHSSTRSRIGNTGAYIRTKGAVFSHLYPVSWPLRMLMHALRSVRSGEMGAAEYMRHWLRGVRDAKRLNVFAR